MYDKIKQEQYHKIIAGLAKLSRADAVAHLRNLCRHDLYFLIRYVLKRTDFDHPWLFDRCREVQASPNGHLDLWARDHRKSTIITFGKTIQDILSSHGDNPLPGWWGDRELTAVIFSFNRPTAKKFLDQIKTELENNAQLKEWFPDILYQDPQKESPKWSLDEGLLVKRKGNPKEKTIEAYGIIDSMPTGGHWMLRIYDDVITEKVARNPDVIKKSIEQWELSLNLGTSGPGQTPGQERYIGTRYTYNDAYRIILERNAAQPRIYPATDNGKEDGNSIFLTQTELADKRRKMGPYTFGAQMLQNPVASDNHTFLRDWLRFADTDGTNMNLYLIVDPAGAKKKDSDYTAIKVIGLGADGNKYLIDAVRDRLNLAERTRELFRLHRKYRPGKVYYERYGKDSDIEHIKLEQTRNNYRFEIIELGGNKLSKEDRIKRLQPDFEAGQFYLPNTLLRSQDGKLVDLVEQFINEEYSLFPMANIHDDMLDAMSRIYDCELIWPKQEIEDKPTRYNARGNVSWMGRL